MFTKPYTDLDAYWVGFLRADGRINIGRSGRSKTLNFELSDIEPVEALKSYINAENEIRCDCRTAPSGGISITYILQSALPAYALDALGLKSEFDLDPWFYSSSHFWRGMIDGDGSLCWYRYSTYPGLSLYGTLNDMNQFSNWIYSQIKERIKIYPVKSIYSVQTRGAKAVYLTKLLYENKYTSLPRKQEAATSIMSWKSDHKNSWQLKT